MTTDHQELIEALKAQLQSVTPQDPMPEAGRKGLLKVFVRMLEHEAGSRTGEDVEDVHQIRVATRRIRSLLRQLGPYYRPKVVSRYRRRLRKVAQALGAVRDLDVLMADLSQFQKTLRGEQRANIQTIIASLDEQRTSARQELIIILDSDAYQSFVKDFAEFLTTPGQGVKTPDSDGIVPIQVRHVLPGMVYNSLAEVLAYDTVLDEADAKTLHGLRIEFKRLRYLLSLFEDVLGSPTDDFIEELKAIQDHLGRLNDIAIAHEYLDLLVADLDGRGSEAVLSYSAQMDSEASELMVSFPAVWSRFKSRKVQSRLSSGLLALR